MAQRQHVYSEEIHDLIFYIKEDNEYAIIDETQMKHIPKVGDYYVPLHSGNLYLVKAVIHDDLRTYIVLEKRDNEFSEIASLLYQDKESKKKKSPLDYIDPA